MVLAEYLCLFGTRIVKGILKVIKIFLVGVSVILRTVGVVEDFIQ